MIHIIGASHSLQVWTDAKRSGESLDARKETVEAFESYLADVAKSLKADMIAEEASDEWVAAHGHGASSVAKGVTAKLGIQHLFCDPDTGQRRALGLKVGQELCTHAMTVSKETGREWTDVHDTEIKKQFSTREAYWLDRLNSCEPNNRSIIFVCGADHVDTFQAALDAKKILASICCRDRIEGAKLSTTERSGPATATRFQRRTRLR
jgi:hypothetical protein